ncbi:MAG: phosphoribosylamine--glycine ligase [Xanthomonadales bacterium]|nr:phosphoribosylamine--glycine ligase [Xanthomonadales bacterium]
MRQRRVLVIGAGGREHALAWRLRASPQVSEVLVAPGNAGTARERGIRNVPVEATDIDGLLALARQEQIDLTVVGPEAPLAAGVVDAFEAAGLAIFGPSRLAAELEASKSYAKAFLERQGIPTAAHRVFEQLEPALAYVRSRGAPIVVKADGLAAGKGVVVAMDLPTAEQALTDMLGGGSLGAAGHRVVVEDFLAGEEASYMVIADGTDYLPLASSQDHKRRDDGDQGPNTGGMGAYSPAPVVTEAVEARIRREVIEPTLAGLQAEGRRFRGFLYAGVMIDPDGAVQVLEFNVRLGDPETQPLMLRLDDDLCAHLQAAVDGQLAGREIHWDARPAVGVVMAAAGYPQQVRSGDVIHGLDVTQVGDVKVFHAGTRLLDQEVVTAGGRVLTVCALGQDYNQARNYAYQRVASLRWEGAFQRSDIAHRALQPR